MRVCFSAAQDGASANAALDFLRALTRSSGKGTGGPQVNAGIGMAVAQTAAAASDKPALARFEEEWRRVMSTNQQFRDAVVKYRELENEPDEASGATIRIPIPSFTLNGRQCEASTYTERADAEDHIFGSDYPIGDNVLLESVRVRNLTCTCEEPTQ